MDAKCRKRRRESVSSLRQQRWSMSSQRLEQIVAALMKPVSHHGQSFDRDDAGLLEEYLTGAGLRLLDAEEAGEEGAAPNYAEVGMLLQSYANNYSRKVDHLCKMAASFSSELSGVDRQDSPVTAGAGVAAASPAEKGARRRRGAGVASGSFEPIVLVAQSSARRAPPPSCPPPTLPRQYSELQPRPPRAYRALRDYSGEVIGSLDDFHVTWSLQDGYLTEQLSFSEAPEPLSRLAPLSLQELQEACARGAHTPTPGAHTPPPGAHTPPPGARTPSPPASRSPSPPPPPPPCEVVDPRAPPPAALRRKRTNAEARLLDLSPGCLKFFFDIELHLAPEEYRLSARWIQRVVRHRRAAILRGRRELASSPVSFSGFDSVWQDAGGFPGWADDESREAGVAADVAARRLSVALAGPASRPASASDDGFFERNSSPLPESELAAWRTAVGARARLAPPLELAALDRDVRSALPAVGGAATWDQVWAGARARQPRAARVLLDVLMKTNRGELAIEPGAPLSMGSFSVRVLTGPRPPRRGDEDWLALERPPPPDH